MPSHSIYTNTGIVETSWNSRGLIVQGGVTKALISQDNGILWAAVREGHVRQSINIYKSSDNGFSWQRMWSGVFSQTYFRTSVENLNTNGPTMHLSYNEERKMLTLYHSFFNTQAANIGGQRYDIEVFLFTVEENTITKITDFGGSSAWVQIIATDMDDLWFDITYSDNGMYLTYVRGSAVTVQFFNHTYNAASDGGTYATTDADYFSLISTTTQNDEKLHILGLREVSTNIRVVYLTYDRLTAAFTAPVTILTTPLADIDDLNLERDSYGNLCAFWNQTNVAGTDVSQKYSISVDDGVTWSAAATIAETAGQTDYTDVATSLKTGRTVMIAGLQGFMLGYVRNHGGFARGYVRVLHTEDGSTYVLSDEETAASAIENNVSGFRFFRPVGTGLVNLSNPGEIRIAYNVGNCNTTIQIDREPSYFGQKLLNDEAYPETIFVDWTADVALTNELLFNFNLLGSVDDNINYYLEGLIGGLTEKYITAFNRFGTSVLIEEYQPIQQSLMADKASYSHDNSYHTRAFFQDVTYSFPVQSGNEAFGAYVERDMRKLHLPPDFHLSRTFLINDGNKLRRTVWLMAFGGNKYELSQVVPKFVDNQIAYYTANAYVVGPSRNPFTRTILPSET